MKLYFVTSPGRRQKSRRRLGQETDNRKQEPLPADEPPASEEEQGGVGRAEAARGAAPGRQKGRI